MVRAGSDFHFATWASAGCAVLRFIASTARFKFVFKFIDETQNRPRASFAKSANSAALDALGNAYQIICVRFTTVTIRETMQRFAHPERTFAARRALAAAFVRVK